MDNSIIESGLNENKLPFKKEKSRKATVTVSIILLIIGAVIQVFAQLLNKFNKGFILDGNSFGYMVGTIIGSGLLVAIIIFIAYKIKSENKRANFLIIISIILLFSHIANFAQATYEITIDNMQKIKTQAAITEMWQNDFVNGNIKTTKFTEEVYGVNATKLTVFQRLLNKIIVEKKKYNEVHNFLMTDTYINKSLLSSKDSISSSISELENHKNIINSYKNVYFGSSEELRNTISDMNISYAYKKTYLEVFDSITIDNKIIFEEYCKIEMEYCDCYIDLLEFLRNSFGKFEVDESDTCVFYEQKDIDLFNEKVDTLNSILQKQADSSKKIEELTKKIQ